MKIEDSPFQSNNTSAVEKLRRNAGQSSFDFSLEELDMSFLDLLGTLTGSVKKTGVDALAETASKRGGPMDLKKAAADKTTKVAELKPSNKAASVEEEEFHTRVDSDMTLTQQDLSLLDIQYLKQEVIPGLPILIGSVPFHSVFPQGKDGEISYKGFELSPKLAELIEKGYKTGRPIRLELDPNSALVLKIRNGQVSAEFVSNDKAAAFAMQQELDDLRNRMAARNLPVGTLEYKYQDSRQRQKDDENSESKNDER